MDQQPERRDMDGFGAHRPALERRIRRTFEGIEGPRPQSGRQRADDAPAPAVERMGAPVARLGRGGEGAPAPRSRGTDEDDRLDAG
jgi:hypothetical protein